MTVVGFSMRELKRRSYAPCTDWLERSAEAASFRAWAARLVERLVVVAEDFAVDGLGAWTQA